MATAFPCFLNKISHSSRFNDSNVQNKKIASIYSFDEPKHFHWHISVVWRKSELYKIMKQVFGYLINGKRFSECVKHIGFLWLWRWIAIHGSVAWNLTLSPHTHPLCLVHFRRLLLPMLILPHNLQVTCKILLLNNIIWRVCCCLQFIALPHHFTTELQGWTELNRVQLPWKSIHSHVTTTPVSVCVCVSSLSLLVRVSHSAEPFSSRPSFIPALSCQWRTLTRPIKRKHIANEQLLMNILTWLK